MLNRLIGIVKSKTKKEQMHKIIELKIKIRNFLCSFLPMNDEIILESHPDLACNTYEVFKYMLEKGVNKRHHIVWLVNDPLKFDDYNAENVEFIKIYPETRSEKIKLYIRCFRARMILCCNRHVLKSRVSKKQLNIYIQHGSPIKKVNEVYAHFSCGFVIMQSPFFAKYSVLRENIGTMVPLGFPRNDQLFRKYNSIKDIYEDAYNFDKIIIWVPTFREHFNKKRVDCDSNFPLGIPILYTQDDVKMVNTFLKETNMLLILKPHPAQDLGVMKDLKCSNIRLLYNDRMLACNVQTNELLAQTDAMIGDYSGIYYDYLLLDKPVGITLDDYEEYRRQTGMVFDNPKDILKGRYIYNTNDFIEYLGEVSRGEDYLIEERKSIKMLTNIEPYDGSTKRVYDFIAEKYELFWGEEL